jgi:hypothetical protein
MILDKAVLSDSGRPIYSGQGEVELLIVDQVRWIILVYFTLAYHLGAL